MNDNCFKYISWRIVEIDKRDVYLTPQSKQH